jgi:hypothetical protein
MKISEILAAEAAEYPAMYGGAKKGLLEKGKEKMEEYKEGMTKAGQKAYKAMEDMPAGYKYGGAALAGLGAGMAASKLRQRSKQQS